LRVLGSPCDSRERRKAKKVAKNIKLKGPNKLVQMGTSERDLQSKQTEPQAQEHHHRVNRLRGGVFLKRQNAGEKRGRILGAVGVPPRRKNIDRSRPGHTRNRLEEQKSKVEHEWQGGGHKRKIANREGEGVRKKI